MSAPLTPLAVAFGGLHWGEFLPPLLGCLAYLPLYTKRARTLAREHRPIPGWRVISFTTGVLVLAIVQIGRLDTLADQVLVAHMVQHIIIGDLCSLLIVLGLTGPMLQPLMHIRATRPLRTLAHPLAALALWALNLYAWHLPLLYQLAVRHDLIHALEHASLLWFGMLLWLALIGPLPKPSWFTGWGQPGYIIAVRVIGAVLADALIWAQTIFYPVYQTSDAARGLNPVSDQNVAGGIMMVEQIILTTLLLGWLFYRFATQDEERQRLLDLADERGIQLTNQRAARAAAAGTTTRLRQRLLDTPPPTPTPHHPPPQPQTRPRSRHTLTTADPTVPKPAAQILGALNDARVRQPANDDPRLHALACTTRPQRTRPATPRRARSRNDHDQVQRRSLAGVALSQTRWFVPRRHPRAGVQSRRCRGQDEHPRNNKQSLPSLSREQPSSHRYPVSDTADGGLLCRWSKRDHR